MQQNNTHLIVGRFGGVYGIKGWLRISSFTRPSDNIFSYSPWLLEVNGSWKEISLEEFQKRGERFFVKIIGIDSPEDARQYTNCDVAITSEQLPSLKKGEHYWRDLINLKVINQDGILNIIDVLTLVDFIQDSNTGSLNPYLADVNADEIINFLDMISIVREIMGF